MKVAVVVVVALIGLASARIVQVKDTEYGLFEKEVCYEHYGCFDTASPWTSLLHRPISAVPNPPHEVGTRFVLYTRGSHETEEIGYELLPDKDAVLKWSDFQPGRKTYFLIHGFTDNHRATWIWDTKTLLLKNENVNIISVDWAPGAKSPYLKATANARLVGAQIARMITYLEQKGGLKMADVHVISHSLGGHVAGYAGNRLMGRIPRITAIDPTDPYFGGTPELVRLDTTDAKFVEVIHSNDRHLNNLGLGIPEAIGHVDIFPNGGAKQPGCKDTLGNLITSIVQLITLNLPGAISTWACSHVRAAHYYAESITEAETCPFVSFACDNYNAFQKGNCYKVCNGDGKCIPLGYNSKKHSPSATKYYLRTSEGKNNQTFCMQVVRATASVGLNQETASGTLTVSFKGKDGSLSDRLIVADGVKLQPGQLVSAWIEVPNFILANAEDNLDLVLRYERSGLLQPKTLDVSSVNLQIIKADLSFTSVNYGGATLENKVDSIVRVE